MKEKITRSIALAVVTITSAALVAYLKSPENRKALKSKAGALVKKAKRYARKYAKDIQYELK